MCNVNFLDEKKFTNATSFKSVFNIVFKMKISVVKLLSLLNILLKHRDNYVCVAVNIIIISRHFNF